MRFTIVNVRTVDIGSGWGVPPNPHPALSAHDCVGDLLGDADGPLSPPTRGPPVSGEAISSGRGRRRLSPVAGQSAQRVDVSPGLGQLLAPHARVSEQSRLGTAIRLRGSVFQCLDLTLELHGHRVEVIDERLRLVTRDPGRTHVLVCHANNLSHPARVRHTGARRAGGTIDGVVNRG